MLIGVRYVRQYHPIGENTYNLWIDTAMEEDTVTRWSSRTACKFRIRRVRVFFHICHCSPPYLVPKKSNASWWTEKIERERERERESCRGTFSICNMLQVTCRSRFGRQSLIFDNQHIAKAPRTPDQHFHEALQRATYTLKSQKSLHCSRSSSQLNFLCVAGNHFDGETLFVSSAVCEIPLETWTKCSPYLEGASFC
jgi:hypothetical protein